MGHTTTFAKWAATFLQLAGTIMVCQRLGLIAAGSKQPNIYVAVGFLLVSLIMCQMIALVQFTHNIYAVKTLFGLQYRERTESEQSSASE